MQIQSCSTDGGFHTLSPYETKLAQMESLLRYLPRGTIIVYYQKLKAVRLGTTDFNSDIFSLALGELGSK